jgi:hypothetical protein
MILNDLELDAVCGGGFDLVNSGLQTTSEMSMISLQSLVSQRSTMLQLVTNMMSSMGNAQKAVASNIGR